MIKQIKPLMTLPQVLLPLQGLVTRSLVVTALVTCCVTLPGMATESPLPQMFPILQGINLTAQQTTDLQALRGKMLPQLTQLLTPDQKEQLKAELAAGKGLRAAVLSLNLSPSQRVQIMQLLKGMQSQITQILTPEQQQRARQNLQSLQRQGR
jgi:hypothetical protein